MSLLHLQSFQTPLGQLQNTSSLQSDLIWLEQSKMPTPNILFLQAYHQNLRRKMNSKLVARPDTSVRHRQFSPSPADMELKKQWWHNFIIIGCMDMKCTHLQLPVWLMQSSVCATWHFLREPWWHICVGGFGLHIHGPVTLTHTHTLTCYRVSSLQASVTSEPSTWMLLPHAARCSTTLMSPPKLCQSHLMTLMWGDWYSRLTRRPLHLTAVFTSPHN